MNRLLLHQLHVNVWPILFVLLRCSTFAIAATPTSFTLEQVMSSPFPSELVAASHATRVAWAFNAKGVRNIWVADGPDFAARQVTHYGADDGEPLASLRITPDGRTVVYARGSDVLAATITSRIIGRRVAPLPGIRSSRGDVERVVTFHVDDAEAVLAILKP